MTTGRIQCTCRPSELYGVEHAAGSCQSLNPLYTSVVGIPGETPTHLYANPMEGVGWLTRLYGMISR